MNLTIQIYYLKDLFVEIKTQEIIIVEIIQIIIHFQNLIHLIQSLMLKKYQRLLLKMIEIWIIIRIEFMIKKP